MSPEAAAAAVRMALDSYRAALRAPDMPGPRGGARWYQAVEGARLAALEAIVAYGDARAAEARREALALGNSDTRHLEEDTRQETRDTRPGRDARGA
jgi:hypothetical protein